MKNWLIRLLGGVTREDHETLVRTEAALHSWQSSEVNDLRRRLDIERAEVKRLSRGLSDPETETTPGPPAQEPIAMRGMSWMQRKSHLEKRERENRESREAHVRNIESQWANRDTLKSTGPVY